jgi:excisionase family DNA binding protein
MFSEYNDILSVADVCEILLIGRNSVYDLLNRGQLKGFRVGKSNWRIPKKSLETYIVQKCRINN